MPHTRPLTEDKRRLYNANRRKRWRDMMLHDNEAHSAKVAQRAAWTQAKIARCPAYKTLIRLRKRQHELKESINFHLEQLRQRERRLLLLTKKIADLAQACRGK